MRRQEKEITDRSQLEAIIAASQVCRLAMSDGGQPYIVPLCFGYRENRLYFHSAAEGRKIDILRRNPQVCFEFDLDARTVPSDSACGWTMHYHSVIGFGTAEILDGPEDKRLALEIIMKHYAGDGPHHFAGKAFDKTLVIQVTIAQMTGKQSG
jgi:nitroimidazol reductase NimA-like FMN-containing flavoprotein (pyridoxamine 5'-phosphate oxidase superfamily)